MLIVLPKNCYVFHLPTIIPLLKIMGEKFKETLTLLSKMTFGYGLREL